MQRAAWVLAVMLLSALPSRAEIAYTSSSVDRVAFSGEINGVVATPEIPYSEFLDDVNGGKISAVWIRGDSIEARLRDDHAVVTTVPARAERITVDSLLRNKVTITAEHPADFKWAMDAVVYGAMLAVFAGAIIWYLKAQTGSSGTGGTVTSDFGRSRARRFGASEIKTTFADVAGIEESKEEITEIVEFLRSPERYQEVGARIPKGVLMAGPPGTGKTLLARAIAGEAGVPFFSICGSDFVEMYVGVGAARVRDLFEQAKQHAPCIVFIDEIDAVGRSRGPGLSGGGSQEREQTLDQLLVEMDGFENNRGVIVIAATNRPDMLDGALLRPGRFDRQVIVPLPDLRGREQILRVHMRGIPFGEDVEPAVIARGTPGLSGADLANLVNEAALFAAREDKAAVGMREFGRAQDKLMLGSERRSKVLSPEERRVAAYHEAGHAIVSIHVPDHDPVYKVSILPRGHAVGVTAYLPDADRRSQTRQALDSRMCALLGGRAAEALIFGEELVTTSASDDLASATAIARRMVTEYGMAETLGVLDYSTSGGQPVGDARRAQPPKFSDATAQGIDEAMREIVACNYGRARRIIMANVSALHAVATALIQNETLDAERFRDILNAHGAMRGQPPSSRLC